MGGLQNKPGCNGREKYSMLGIRHHSSNLYALNDPAQAVLTHSGSKNVGNFVDFPKSCVA